MKIRLPVIIGLLFIFSFTPAATAQDNPGKEKSRPLFFQATIYPTYSLARYDYNINLDEIELRVYINLRDQGRNGAVIKDARILINGHLIPFVPEKKDYRNNIPVKNSKLTNSLEMAVSIPDGRSIKKSVTFPGWLILTQPKPAMLNPGRDIVTGWEYSEDKFPVFFQADDFKKGTKLISRRNVKPGQKVKLEGEKVPPDTIVRIWITSEWFFKKYLTEAGFVRGSEISFLPWSQTFVRIKAADK